ncbi:MAG: DUF2784 domain-containing protein [Planctomycetes bacterium]|nr:DUF2784 domain-containing protein [Planctomycetota bacterium]
MFWRFFADFIVLVHFLFVVFMIVGFLFTFAAVVGVYVFRRRGIFTRFFGWRVFRWVHVCGIGFVGLLAVMERYCPLTILENLFRRRSQNGGQYSESFIIHYVEKLLYPDVHPQAILIPTILIAIFTLSVFILRPPWREKLRNIAEKL